MSFKQDSPLGSPARRHPCSPLPSWRSPWPLPPFLNRSPTEASVVPPTAYVLSGPHNTVVPVNLSTNTPGTPITGGGAE